jgi:hypothetical protein
MMKSDTMEADDNDALHQAALAVEADEALAAEMDEWEAATISDGLGGDRSGGELTA